MKLTYINQDPKSRVIRYLMRNPGWHTAGEISKAVNSTGCAVGVLISRMCTDCIEERRTATNPYLKEYRYREEVNCDAD